MMSLVFATTVFFGVFFGGVGGGGGGWVLRHSAVQTDFEFEISGSLPSGIVYTATMLYFLAEVFP